MLSARSSPDYKDRRSGAYTGGCENFGPLLGSLNTKYRIIPRAPKKDHSFDKHPYVLACTVELACRSGGR